MLLLSPGDVTVAVFVWKIMRIDRMETGKLYLIKENIEISTGDKAGPNYEYNVLRGWRSWSKVCKRDPFVYLGYKEEDWRYNYQHTSKIHYVLWQGEIWVMDNQFAKHVVPVWNGDNDGQN